jgi:hypothetical protein
MQFMLIVVTIAAAILFDVRRAEPTKVPGAR